MVTHWDGWIHDNIMIGNGKFGLAGRKPTASITITGNRIEWNAHGGILFDGGNHYNVVGNFIDRSGGPGLVMRAKANDTDPNKTYSINTLVTPNKLVTTADTLTVTTIKSTSTSASAVSGPATGVAMRSSSTMPSRVTIGSRSPFSRMSLVSSSISAFVIGGSISLMGWFFISFPSVVAARLVSIRPTTSEVMPHIFVRTPLCR